MLILKDKLFATYSHYTDAMGMNGILNSGFRIGDQISCFPLDKDLIRSKDKDLDVMLQNAKKRSDRLDNKRVKFIDKIDKFYNRQDINDFFKSLYALRCDDKASALDFFESCCCDPKSRYFIVSDKGRDNLKKIIESLPESYNYKDMEEFSNKLLKKFLEENKDVAQDKHLMAFINQFEKNQFSPTNWEYAKNKSSYRLSPVKGFGGIMGGLLDYDSVIPAVDNINERKEIRDKYDVTDKGFFVRYVDKTSGKGGVSFPDEYKQLGIMDGKGFTENGHLEPNKSIYRIIFDSDKKPSKPGLNSYINEQRFGGFLNGPAAEYNIKVEIPKGMTNNPERLKNYINDLKTKFAGDSEFLERFNLNDKNTIKELDVIRKHINLPPVSEYIASRVTRPKVEQSKPKVTKASVEVNTPPKNGIPHVGSGPSGSSKPTGGILGGGVKFPEFKLPEIEMPKIDIGPVDLPEENGFAEHLRKHGWKYALGAGVVGAGLLAYSHFKDAKERRKEMHRKINKRMEEEYV